MGLVIVGRSYDVHKDCFVELCRLEGKCEMDGNGKKKLKKSRIDLLVFPSHQIKG